MVMSKFTALSGSERSAFAWLQLMEAKTTTVITIAPFAGDAV